MNYCLFKKGELKEMPYKYVAVYFRMGNYCEGDDVPKKWFGLDCPFDDSLVIRARSISELRKRMDKIYDAGLDKKVSDLEEWDDRDPEYETGDFDGTLPDIICNGNGKLALDLMKFTQGNDYDPKSDLYSHGRENILQFWKREKWRFIS